MEDKVSLDKTIMRKGNESRIISPENNFNSFEYFSPVDSEVSRSP